MAVGAGGHAMGVAHVAGLTGMRAVLVTEAHMWVFLTDRGSGDTSNYFASQACDDEGTRRRPRGSGGVRRAD